MTGQEGKLPHRNHPVHLTRRLAFVRLTFALDFLFGFALAVDFFLAFGLTRSGSVADPVSRFHSSNVLLDISPLSKSSANFLRCAWLLNGITPPYLTKSRLATPAGG
jgi:hypothetical protein